MAQRHIVGILASDEVSLREVREHVQSDERPERRRPDLIGVDRRIVLHFSQQPANYFWSTPTVTRVGCDCRNSDSTQARKYRSGPRWLSTVSQEPGRAATVAECSLWTTSTRAASRGPATADCSAR